MLKMTASPTITIDGNRAQHVTPEGQTFAMPLEDLFRHVQDWQLENHTGVLPPEVVLHYRRGKFTIWVGQYSPCIRPLNWIKDDSPAPFGPGTTYSLRSVALPYVIVVAAFVEGSLSSANECFFATKPIDSDEDKLYFPALLNVSKFPDQEDKPLAWICTQHLKRDPIESERDPWRRMRVGWQLLNECLFSDSFNRSSEMHEGASYYELSRHVDPRISSIDRWEAESRKSPLFMLEVRFLDTEHTLRQVVDRTFAHLGAHPRVLCADDLARLIVNYSSKVRKPR